MRCQCSGPSRDPVAEPVLFEGRTFPTPTGRVQLGQCANALTVARATDDGGGACYYDTPVRIVP